MAAYWSVYVSESALERANRLLREFPGEAQKATWRAAKRAGQSGKTLAKRYASRVYNIKASDFDKNTKFRIKQKGGSSGTASVGIVFEGQLIDLYSFGKPKERKPDGVTYKVKHGVSIHAPHAFTVAKFGSRVFKRVGKPKLPIRKFYGPASPIMLDDTDVKIPLGEKILETFNKRLAHEVEWILSRK